MTGHHFTPGVLTAADAAALNDLMRQVNGQLAMDAKPPLAIARQGFDGQPVLYLDPSFLPAPAHTPAKFVTDTCLVADAYGAVVGIAQFEEHADGRGRCVVRGVCCDTGSVTVPGGPDDPEPATLNTINVTGPASRGFSISGVGSFTLTGAGNSGPILVVDGSYTVTLDSAPSETCNWSVEIADGTPSDSGVGYTTDSFSLSGGTIADVGFLTSGVVLPPP